MSDHTTVGGNSLGPGQPYRGGQSLAFSRGAAQSRKARTFNGKGPCTA